MEIQSKQPTAKGPARMFAADHSIHTSPCGKSLSEDQDGPETEWGDKVTDQEYEGQ
jgi:hypothetical protein